MSFLRPNDVLKDDCLNFLVDILKEKEKNISSEEEIDRSQEEFEIYNYNYLYENFLSKQDEVKCSLKITREDKENRKAVVIETFKNKVVSETNMFLFTKSKSVNLFFPGRYDKGITKRNIICELNEQKQIVYKYFFMDMDGEIVEYTQKIFEKISKETGKIPFYLLREN